MDTVSLRTPLSDEVIQTLKAGMDIRLNGVVFAARDMAHKRLCERIESGNALPIDLKGQVIYFVGPTPAPTGRPIGAAGPTTSARMDAFSPFLLAIGLKGMIGKGYRNESVRSALQKFRAVHFSTLGGAGALLSRHIVSSEVVAYEDLGTEAIRKLELVDFPCVVAYDAFGANVYDAVGLRSVRL